MSEVVKQDNCPGNEELMEEIKELQKASFSIAYKLQHIMSDLDPDQSIKSARAEAEKWRHKYLAEQDEIKKIKNRRDHHADLYIQLDGCIFDMLAYAKSLDSVLCEDQDVTYRMATHLIDKVHEVAEIYHKEPESEDELELKKAA